MTLRSSDLQSDGDLDSIRNSCDVFMIPCFLEGNILIVGVIFKYWCHIFLFLFSLRCNIQSCHHSHCDIGRPWNWRRPPPQIITFFSICLHSRIFFLWQKSKAKINQKSPNVEIRLKGHHILSKKCQCGASIQFSPVTLLLL